MHLLYTLIARISNDMQNVGTHKEVDGHGDADDDDESAHQPGIDLARVVRSTEAADDGTENHKDRLGPVDRARDDKSDHGDSIDTGCQHRLQSVHDVDILHPHQRERCQHQDADAAAKISSIRGDDKLRYGDADEPGERELRFAHIAYA